jgi:hypothetical protein
LSIFTKEEQIIYDHYISYMDSYFLSRDLKTTLAKFGTNTTVFGTGLDEVISDDQELEKFFKRDIEQAPNTISYTIKSTEIRVFSNNTGIVLTEFNINTTISKQILKLNNLRLTLVFVKTKDTWLIEHKHISLPTDAHESDEAYPVKELEERMVVLHKLVEEKTEELKAKNDELESALSNIKILSGFLPICSYCKNIRDDAGYWKSIEEYISANSELDFSHSICPSCVKKHYPDL